MTGNRISGYRAVRPLVGFVAGFLATLTFHQLTLALLWGVGLAAFRPFSMAATQPFGVPVVLSLAFWGGVWGVLFVWFEGRFPARAGYWISAFLFGAILPSAVALLVVAPLKGRPLGGGWHAQILLIAFLINGAWGVGTGVFFRLLSGRTNRVGAQPSEPVVR